jgi:hypothetical protein
MNPIIKNIIFLEVLILLDKMYLCCRRLRTNMTKVLNVVPINDLIEHENTVMCDCDPKLLIENSACILIHNALDGRL